MRTHMRTSWWIIYLLYSGRTLHQSTSAGGVCCKLIREALQHINQCACYVRLFLCNFQSFQDAPAFKQLCTRQYLIMAATFCLCIRDVIFMVDWLRPGFLSPPTLNVLIKNLSYHFAAMLDCHCDVWCKRHDTMKIGDSVPSIPPCLYSSLHFF